MAWGACLRMATVGLAGDLGGVEGDDLSTRIGGCGFQIFRKAFVRLAE